MGRRQDCRIARGWACSNAIEEEIDVFDNLDDDSCAD